MRWCLISSGPVPVSLSSTTGEPVRTFSYDDWGDCVRSDETADGLARIVEETDGYVFRDNEVWRDSVRIISSSDPTIIPITNRTQRLIGDATTPPFGDATPSSRPASQGLCHFTESRTIDARGNTSRTWSVFDPTTSTRTTYRQRPESSHLAISEECDGVGILSGSFSAVTNRVACDAYRRETARTDGRGNVTRLLYDAKGNVTNETDAAGFSIAFGYDAMNRLVATTNQIGAVVYYEYDAQGRKVFEGGATYPVRYTYDLYGNRTSITTYRDVSSNVGDMTTWLYDNGVGVVTNKVYADGSRTIYLLTDEGRVARRIWARGVRTDYGYDGFGNVVSMDYSDQTPRVELFYDALGRKSKVVDVKGITTYAYDVFGDECVIATTGLYEKTLIRNYDEYGRDVGFTVDGSRIKVSDYESDKGRVCRTQFGGVWYSWDYLDGTDLKNRLNVGSVGDTAWDYEDHRDLLTRVCNRFQQNVVSCYDFAYDSAGRRISQSRSGTAFSEMDSDLYGYNVRNELVSVMTNDSELESPIMVEYAYQYDDIGNRIFSKEHDFDCAYVVNNLNQYQSTIDINNQIATSNSFDADGNQTLICKNEGMWIVHYNGENRPVRWYRLDTDSNTLTTLIMCYDHIGRRVEYVETVSAMDANNVCVTNKHYKFFYDNYLCIQRLEGSTNSIIDIFGWDPTEESATRPLFWQVRGPDRPLQSFFYTHDGNKNVSEVIPVSETEVGFVHYNYEPFGKVSSVHSTHVFDESAIASLNPWRFSSEFLDEQTGCVGFNFRTYDPFLGRWHTREPIGEELSLGLYGFSSNSAISGYDCLGLLVFKNSNQCPNKCGDDITAIVRALRLNKLRSLDNTQRILDQVKKGSWKPVPSGWQTHSSVVGSINAILSEFSNGTTEVDCCPTSNGCRAARDLGGGVPAAAYAKTDKEKGKPGKGIAFDFSSPLVKGGTLYLCNRDKIRDLGGCGCAIIHELVHRTGLFADEKEYNLHDYKKDNAVVEITRILLKGTNLHCKGYDIWN